MMFPFGSEMQSDGMVIVGSTPAMPHGAVPVLLTTTTPTAPAFWAFLTFTANPQTPRSMSAMLPAICAAFVNGGRQPFVVDVSGAGGGPGKVPTPSSASTTLSVSPANVSGGPKAAPPAAQTRCSGLLMTRSGAGVVCVEHALTERTPAGASVPAPLIMSTTSPQMSEYDSLSAPGCHW